ncbi:dipeptide ABC transporter ATP-binding protein [Aurantivibrio infirmus]
MSEVILKASGLSKTFAVNSGPVWKRKHQLLKAVDGVDIEICKRETVAIVGESGCGKTTLSRLLLLLDEPSCGDLIFLGKETQTFSANDLKDFRRKVQPVFQNPYASLNPRMRAGRIIAEPLAIMTQLSQQEISIKVEKALVDVGLKSSDAEKYPHEFSGGQRQRIAIARAIISEPSLVILDEPVASQDISIQAQILNLLKDLQDKLNISFLFIAHDLATVRFMSDKVCVMYLGKVVEFGDSEEVILNPKHPYTQALISAHLPDSPAYREQFENKLSVTDELPSPLNPPPGCRFHTRCPKAQAGCSSIDVEFKKVEGRNHQVACVLYDE